MIFAAPPPDFRKQVDIVSCWVFRDDRFLLLHRRPDKPNGGTWGLPAGKVDAHETLLQAACRELFEESALDIPEADLIFLRTVHVRHRGCDLDWHMFSITLESLPDVQFNPVEHQGYAWVTPADALEFDLIHDLEEAIQLYVPAA